MLGAVLAALLAAADAAVPQPPAPAPARVSGQVRGTISYGRHVPAAGVVVVVRPESSASPIRAATTGINGTFAFDGLADGTYRAEVRRDGYVPVKKTALRVRAPFRAIVEVLLERGAAPLETPPVLAGIASLAGTIRLALGSPVPEAHVRLTRPDGTADSRVVLTDGAGAFSLDGLRAGRWRFEVQGAGLLPLRADLDLVGEVSIESQLAAQPANYRPLPQELLVRWRLRKVLLSRLLDLPIIHQTL